MNNNAIKEFFNELVLDKFLLNFIPGLILFYVLTMFIPITVGEGLTTLLIVASASWVLGLLLELIFFRATYFARREGKKLTTNEQLNLLFGKIGVSTIIACILSIDLVSALRIFDDGIAEEIAFSNPVVKFLLFGIIGITLYLFYSKNNSTEE